MTKPNESRIFRGYAGGLPCCLAIFIATLCLGGCTEEKAKTLQLGAESFKSEADAACAMGADSIKASVAMPLFTRSEIAQELQKASRFNAKQLETIYASAEISEEGIAPVIDTLKKACAAQRQLAAIYAELPRGYLLATDDVKRAHKYVVNVTLRFAKFAQVFSSLPNVGKDNVARIKIIEAQKRAMAVTDEKARAPLLDAVAEEILENQAREALSRAQVLAQFAKAISRGEQLTQMSVDYDKVSVADMLESLKEFSSLFGNITGRTGVAQDAIGSINAVDARIRNDPRLSPLIDVDLTH